METSIVLKGGQIKKQETNNISIPKYKLIEGKFKDQFGNIVEGAICHCGNLGVKSKMEGWTNYGGTKRKIFLCENCWNEFGGSERINKYNSKVSQGIFSVDDRKRRRSFEEREVKMGRMNDKFY